MPPAKKARKLTDTQKGVIKMMEKPGVLEAVLTVIETDLYGNGLHVEEPDAAAADAAEKPNTEAAPAVEEEEEAAEEPPLPPPPKPPPGPAKLPTIEVMQGAGYQGSAAQMRGTWQWAKDFGRDHVVWPTPTSGLQEALRFDAHGWPHSQTTPAEWIDMLTYWSVLREQMVCGASRSGRNAAESQLNAFQGRRR